MMALQQTVLAFYGGPLHMEKQLTPNAVWRFECVTFARPDADQPLTPLTHDYNALGPNKSGELVMLYEGIRGRARPDDICARPAT
jgi:hypothetical protein